MPCGSAAPIENSPPGIQTMPAGAGPGGVAMFATVAVKTDTGVARSRAAPIAAVASVAATRPLARVALIPIATAPAIATRATAIVAGPRRLAGLSGGGA